MNAEVVSRGSPAQVSGDRIVRGMMESWLRRSCRPISWMGTPSISMEPSVASRTRKSASVRDDFPAPVLVRQKAPLVSD